MYQFILLIHVFAAIFIVALVLVQQGKGATVGAAFGSGASQTLFGSRGSGSFLFRVTISLITIFFITSIALNYIATSAFKKGRVVVLPTPVQQIPTKNTSGPIPASQPKQSSGTAPATGPAPAEIPERRK